MKREMKRGQTWKNKPLQNQVFLPKVSLIIATYNEEATLPSKLQNILDLDYPKDKLEMVFVDSGSKDKTIALIDDFITQYSGLPIIFIREKERLGKSHAINLAYPKASGEIKIISDADAILEKSAITRIVSNFINPKVGAACGRQVLLNANQNPSTKLEKSYRSIYEVLREGESSMDSTPIFHGELSAYRSSLIETLPENKSADDTRLANIIHKKGYRTVYDSCSVFYEYAPPNNSSIRIQKVRRGQGLIRVFWDFRLFLFNREYGKYGMLIYPMEFFMHCVFPGAFLFFAVVLGVSLSFYNPLLLLVFTVLLVGLVGLSRIKSGSLSNLVSFSSLFTSFLNSQVILVYAQALWVSGRSLHKWQKVDDIRQEWKNKK